MLKELQVVQCKVTYKKIVKYKACSNTMLSVVTTMRNGMDISLTKYVNAYKTYIVKRRSYLKRKLSITGPFVFSVSLNSKTIE